MHEAHWQSVFGLQELCSWADLGYTMNLLDRQADKSGTATMGLSALEQQRNNASGTMEGKEIFQ